MSRLRRSLGPLVVLFFGVALAACGDGDEGTDVDALTGCLTDAG